MSMFDAFKNMGGMGELMRKAGEMKQKMQEVQENLARRQITADAGGGMVQATVNGKLALVKIRNDKSKYDVSDTEMLEDLIVAAVTRRYSSELADVMKQEMEKTAGEMGLPPGMLDG